MTEKYVKLSDIGESLSGCASTVGPTVDLTGKIVTRSWFYDLPTVDIDLEEKNGLENEQSKEVPASCPFYRAKQVLNYGEDGVPGVSVVSYCQREKNKGQTDITCYCKGRKIACTYSAKTRREGIFDEMSNDEKERTYWIRTHMTSISRYLKNEKPERAEEYKKLALEAAQAILRMVNGGTAEEED